MRPQLQAIISLVMHGRDD